jgi:endonuclease-3
MERGDYMKKLLKKKDIQKVYEILDKTYPNAITGLDFNTTYELLVATILSAQCTDKRVNIITQELFDVANTPEQMVSLGQAKIKKIIRSCGLSTSKSKNIFKTSKLLINDFNSEVPGEKKELLKLPGVGSKTANVVLAVGFEVPTIPVDTHVFRVSNRIGLVNEKNVKHCEKSLVKRLAKEHWIKWHHLLIHHGRNICKARNPQCQDCPINSYCMYFKNEVEG